MKSSKYKKIIISHVFLSSGKMSGVRDSYFIPFSLNEPISSLAVGKVIESKNRYE